MKNFRFAAVTLAALLLATGMIGRLSVAVSESPDRLNTAQHDGNPGNNHGHTHAAALQSKCCSCGGAFPREVARLCNSCSSKYRSKCCLCSGAFPQDAARLCNSCTSRFRNKCFLCSGAFPKDIARLCSRCTSKY